MKRISTLIVLLLIISLLFSGCSKPETKVMEKPLDKVVLTLDGTPNTNHTGIYAAKERGYFKDEGLDVEIIQPGQDTSEKLVATGKAQFGISCQENVTLDRLQALPIVSIAAIVQHNTSAIAWPSSKEIKTPKDFEDKTYAGWDSPIKEATVKALMEKYSGDFNRVKILVSGTSDFFTATEKYADFAWIYYGWDGVASKIKNKSINYILLKDEDKALDYYTPVIITSEKMIAEKSDIVKRFMKAAVNGYIYASQDPQGAADMLLKNAPKLDKAIVSESQKWLSPRYKDDAPAFGFQKKDVWEDYAVWLHDKKIIENIPDVDKAFTNDFLPSKQ